MAGPFHKEFALATDFSFWHHHNMSPVVTEAVAALKRPAGRGNPNVAETAAPVRSTSIEFMRQVVVLSQPTARSPNPATYRGKNHVAWNWLFSTIRHSGAPRTKRRKNSASLMCRLD